MANLSGSTQVDPRSPVDALDFEEYEALSKPAEAAPPVQEPAKEEKPPAEPADKKASKETAGEPGTPLHSQEKGKKPERKIDAERRIDDLTRDNHELKRRLADLQAKGATLPQVSPPAPAKSVEEAKPAAAAPPAADAEPDLERYIEKYPEESFAKVQARFNRDHFGWLNKQAQAEQARNQAQQTTRQMWQQKLTERPEVPYEAVAGRADDPSSGISLYNGVLDAIQKQFPNWIDVLYYLHDNPAEYQRVHSSRLSPQEQYFEVGLMARSLKGAPQSAPTPEKVSNVRPMVSRLPAPQRTVLTGTMPAPKKSLSDATSFEEAEAIERQRFGGR